MPRQLTSTSLGEEGARRVAELAGGTVPGSEKAVSAIVTVAVRYVSKDATCDGAGGVLRASVRPHRAIRRKEMKSRSASPELLPGPCPPGVERPGQRMPCWAW